MVIDIDKLTVEAAKEFEDKVTQYLEARSDVDKANAELRKAKYELALANGRLYAEDQVPGRNEAAREGFLIDRNYSYYEAVLRAEEKLESKKTILIAKDFQLEWVHWEMRRVGKIIEKDLDMNGFASYELADNLLEQITKEMLRELMVEGVPQDEEE